MPILEITIVLKEGESLPAGLTAALADAAAAVIGSTPGRTWVRLTTLAPGDYAEDSGGPPAGVSPVFVSVLKARLPSQEDLRREAQRLAAAIAATIPRPVENVHLLYEAPGLGRIAFGGNLLAD